MKTSKLYLILLIGMKDMRTKVDRDKLVKQKGKVTIPEELTGFVLDSKIKQRMQELLLEAIASQVSEDPKKGPFSMEGENDERIT